MLIEKNRTIARQRRQIGWLLLFLIFGILWVFSLKEDIISLKSDITMDRVIIERKDKEIVLLMKAVDSLKRIPLTVVIPEKPKEKSKKTPKKDTLSPKVKDTTIIIPEKVKQDSL